MFKQEKGITLVSLVITIIVMLILAGVSLSMVMGEGSVLNQARDAVDTTELSSVKDEIGMALGSAQTNFYAGYASTTNRITMVQALKGLQLKEFTSAAAVSIHAPAPVAPAAGGDPVSTGHIVYQLPNGNIYVCEVTITENSLTAGEITKNMDAKHDFTHLTGVTVNAADKVTIGTPVAEGSGS